MSHIKIPSDGTKITVNNDGTYNIPDNPIVTFIEGDGIGPDLWAASVRVFDAAVEKAFSGSKKYLGQKFMRERKQLKSQKNGYHKKQLM